ncbi:MAG TPA: translation initiation factor IF-3 [Rhodocyclaceae bacterium]|nr:translation initiation factor IF-3 [Rhodocyclaceae bacterium]
MGWIWGFSRWRPSPSASRRTSKRAGPPHCRRKTERPRRCGRPGRSLIGERSIATERSHRLNGEITAAEVRLVGIDNEPIGIVSYREAMRLAEEADVDLVEIAPTAQPPVCRLMDYGKFKYQEQKKAHDARLKQKIIQVKEVKFRPGTDEGDYQIKLRNLIRFLEEGDKAKVTLRFRGREMAHQEFGYRLLERVRGDLEAIGQVEQMPKLEGRQMIMVVSPKKKK